VADARILLVEDDATQRRIVSGILAGEGYDVAAAASVEEAMEVFGSGATVDLVLSDWRLGDSGDGLELMRRLRERDPDVSFVLITAYGTIAHAVEAVHKGVDDYLPKPFERGALLLAVERTLKARRLAEENRRLNQALGERDRLVELMGRTPAMQTVYRQIERLAATDATVLFSGESGTGKELAARALHSLSPRASGPFVAVNCAAIPAELLEAEFFGTRKGAFTGAVADRVGRFQAAAGGTLFLDELAELPLALQPKLLRAVQERRITRVGDSREVDVDVRIVAATNCDLRSEVEAGRFREDLYYRISVVSVVMPPLRERREDLPLLIEHFLQRASRAHGLPVPELPSPVRRALLDHTWPGNVRELANTLERLTLLAEDGAATADDLPSAIRRGERADSGEPTFRLPPTGLDWDELERSLLAQALALANGNRKRAAALLGMRYKTFLYRLEKFGVAAP
jgi:two-component system NtrC family response regulator